MAFQSLRRFLGTRWYYIVQEPKEERNQDVFGRQGQKNDRIARTKGLVFVAHNMLVGTAETIILKL